MNVFIIIICLAAVAVLVMYFSAKNAQEVKEELPKFQPRKVSYIPKKDVIDSMDKPKRKYYKKRNKKKKPAVANNETTEKRPVGRPRKTTE
jgi:flagellar basal body-associated protein FliL